MRSAREFIQLHARFVEADRRLKGQVLYLHVEGDDVEAAREALVDEWCEARREFKIAEEERDQAREDREIQIAAEGGFSRTSATERLKAEVEGRPPE